jgi:hypothetical protein
MMIIHFYFIKQTMLHLFPTFFKIMACDSAKTPFFAGLNFQPELEIDEKLQSEYRR